MDSTSDSTALSTHLDLGANRSFDSVAKSLSDIKPTAQNPLRSTSDKLGTDMCMSFAPTDDNAFVYVDGSDSENCPELNTEWDANSYVKVDYTNTGSPGDVGEQTSGLVCSTLNLNLEDDFADASKEDSNTDPPVDVGEQTSGPVFSTIHLNYVDLLADAVKE